MIQLNIKNYCLQVEKPVAEQKEMISDAKLFNDCPEEWIKIMEHVRSLRYESRPNYKLIYDYLQETLIRFQVSYSDPWDWDLLVCCHQTYHFSLKLSIHIISSGFPNPFIIISFIVIIGSRR